MTIKDKTAVVGLGYTEQGKLPGRSALSLYIEASKNAANDAGLSIKILMGLLLNPVLPTCASVLLAWLRRWVLN